MYAKVFIYFNNVKGSLSCSRIIVRCGRNISSLFRKFKHKKIVHKSTVKKLYLVQRRVNLTNIVKVILVMIRSPESNETRVNNADRKQRSKKKIQIHFYAFVDIKTVF